MQSIEARKKSGGGMNKIDNGSMGIGRIKGFVSPDNDILLSPLPSTSLVKES